jgi:hypothetical protein
MKAMWALTRRQQLPRWNLGGVFSISPDTRRQSRVIIDPEGQEALTVGSHDIVEVWFSKPVSGEGLDEPVVVFRGEERVGILDPEAANIYRSAIQHAYDSGRIPVIDAIRIHGQDDSWELYIGGPVMFPGPSPQ